MKMSTHLLVFMARKTICGETGRLLTHTADPPWNSQSTGSSSETASSTKPKPPQSCNSLESCAQAEGLLPVSFPEFEVILQTYLAKAEGMGVDASVREELKNLATQFFKDGLFVHDQMSFQDFAEDLEDVLEDMVEGGESEEEGSAREEEMEGFEEEVMKKFSLPGAGEKEEKSKGERKKESGRGRG